MFPEKKREFMLSSIELIIIGGGFFVVFIISVLALVFALLEFLEADFDPVKNLIFELVEAASVTNINLSSESKNFTMRLSEKSPPLDQTAITTLDSVFLAGKDSLILLKNQVSLTENGVYRYSNKTASITKITNEDLPLFVHVAEGKINKGKNYLIRKDPSSINQVIIEERV